ncbi:HU family DNA-binding protein [Aequorivita viscosa]|uniref:DNA-binding protein, histone-like, putative n=1 Tax=Aequorivita viscosa TaxID=797419 RepID=A0A1M6FF76_9FLAO|nr:HU family DNA-binding protein [Aequorivita viscosa]SDW68209.1 DNA-binding protein, histone-like, putative [Aequorivita viscosa]SHI96370.1 DNA-binding protein, histone-like, putative [Aequorivita viscosa]
MAIKYRITRRKNTMDSESEPSYIMQAVGHKEVDLRRLAYEISNMSTHTEGDVYGVLLMLIKQLKFHLADGETVVLDELGRFKITFKSDHASSPEQLDKKSIKKFGVNFLPSVPFKKWMKSELEVVREKKK